MKVFSLTALWLLTLTSAFAAYKALHIPTSYSMEQFLPKKHALLTWDDESKRVFHINPASPHILLLSLRPKDKGHWYDATHLTALAKLTREIETLGSVKSVISLGNIQSAFEDGKNLLVAPLPELSQHGFKSRDVLKNPLYTPNLISKDGRDAAVFVMPGTLTQEQHAHLLKRLTSMARHEFPHARVEVGGPAAIRTQLVDLLSHEIALFIFLALMCAVIVLKVMFRGYAVLLQVLYILVIANTFALGIMGLLHLSFNILSSTLPIIVTVSSLGICTHLLVRMGEAADRGPAERAEFLRALIKEISSTILLTGFSTSVGFACLISSAVPLISDYGLAVALGVLVSSATTLVLVASLYLWVKWPIPRPFLREPKRFALFLVRHARWVTPALGVLTVSLALVGTHLSWTARLFDDLPAKQSARRTTELIGKKLGGVATLDFMVGSAKLNEPWKSPANLRKLDRLARELRRDHRVGSVLTVADFLTTGNNKTNLPKTRGAVAEMQFLYSMSGDSPLTQFLSADGKWTRVAVRLPDLPADQSEKLIRSIQHRLGAAFGGMQVKTSGLAAIVPPMNKELSRGLMWGFFEALFWIVLLLTVVFRSLRWALIGIVPNLIPPAALLGFLAYFDVPIKPGIAIIFSISLGIAFDNTIYILGRLKHMLKTRPRESTLPVYTLMKKETMPCLVSSLCLFAGFSIFMFSMFPVNRMFGLFVLLSIIAGLLGDLVWLPSILRLYPRLLLENGRHATIKKFRFGYQEAAMKLSPYLILAGLGLIAFHDVYAAKAPTVQSILKSVEEKSSPPDERVELKMVIKEADGSKKERDMSILRKNDGEARALIRLNRPADLKGLSLLTVSSGGKEDQWLYLPSDKKSRRILGSNKKGKFLDSEIAFEDLRVSTYKEFSNKIVKNTGKLVQIESRAKPGSESSYGRIVTWVSQPDSKIERVDYYDKSGKLLKRAEFKSYVKVGGKFWRAKQVHVVNLQDKRSTDLLIKNVSVKAIDKDEVSLAALEE